MSNIIPDHITTREEAIAWLHRHGYSADMAQLEAAAWEAGYDSADEVEEWEEELEEEEEWEEDEEEEWEEDEEEEWDEEDDSDEDEEEDDES